jgi:hypothetical protein
MASYASAPARPSSVDMRSISLVLLVTLYCWSFSVAARTFTTAKGSLAEFDESTAFRMSDTAVVRLTQSIEFSDYVQYYSSYAALSCAGDFKGTIGIPSLSRKSKDDSYEALSMTSLGFGYFSNRLPNLRVFAFPEFKAFLAKLCRTVPLKRQRFKLPLTMQGSDFVIYLVSDTLTTSGEVRHAWLEEWAIKRRIRASGAEDYNNADAYVSYDIQGAYPARKSRIAVNCSEKMGHIFASHAFDIDGTNIIDQSFEVPEVLKPVPPDSVLEELVEGVCNF